MITNRKVREVSPATSGRVTLWGMYLVAEVWREQPATPTWAVVVGGVTALLIVLISDAWRLARNVITIAHEGGHALASVLSGRRLEGIRLHLDTSGETYSRGPRTGAGTVITAAAGYITPPLLGAGSAWLLASRHVTAMLWLALVLLVATLLMVRNAYGIAAVLATAVCVGAVTVAASPVIQAVFAYACSWFLLLGGVRPVFELRGRRRRTSDADQLAELTGVRAGVWVFAFALIALAALALGARLLVPGSIHITAR
jgi:hypothetical protein